MTEADILSIMRIALRSGVVMATPILVSALIAGLAIGLLQALTSIQELTLTFVPKLFVIVVVFWLTVGFMAMTLLGFFESRVLPIIAG